jgi:hypothetical protein
LRFWIEGESVMYVAAIDMGFYLQRVTEGENMAMYSYGFWRREQSGTNIDAGASFFFGEMAEVLGTTRPHLCAVRLVWRENAIEEHMCMQVVVQCFERRRRQSGQDMTGFCPYSEQILGHSTHSTAQLSCERKLHGMQAILAGEGMQKDKQKHTTAGIR